MKLTNIAGVLRDDDALATRARLLKVPGKHVTSVDNSVNLNHAWGMWAEMGGGITRHTETYTHMWCDSRADAQRGSPANKAHTFRRASIRGCLPNLLQSHPHICALPSGCSLRFAHSFATKCVSMLRNDLFDYQASFRLFLAIMFVIICNTVSSPESESTLHV